MHYMNICCFEFYSRKVKFLLINSQSNNSLCNLFGPAELDEIYIKFNINKKQK